LGTGDKQRIFRRGKHPAGGGCPKGVSGAKPHRGRRAFWFRTARKAGSARKCRCAPGEQPTSNQGRGPTSANLVDDEALPRGAFERFGGGDAGPNPGENRSDGGDVDGRP